MKNDKKIDVLPIGTICKIKERNTELIIIGYFELEKESNIVYDYKATVYPFGILDLDMHFYFNTDDIEKVIYKGYDGISFKSFELGINQAINGKKIEDIFK